MLLPAQTANVVRCDPAVLTITDTLAPDYGLTADAEATIEAAPAWLRPGLTDNLTKIAKDRGLDTSRGVISCLPGGSKKHSKCYLA